MFDQELGQHADLPCRVLAGRPDDMGARRIPVLYGSYRANRLGIRLARYLVQERNDRLDDAELIDARAIDLPMLDRMYNECPAGTAPPALQDLAERIRKADPFVFVTGAYTRGVQPGLKNLSDQSLEEWLWRPAAIASQSAGRFAGVRAALAWWAEAARVQRQTAGTPS